MHSFSLILMVHFIESCNRSLPMGIKLVIDICHLFRFLRQLKVNQRLPRQSSDPICQDDGNATGCLPDGIATAPSELVTCINSTSQLSFTGMILLCMVILLSLVS